MSGSGRRLRVETSGRRRIWLCADDYGISPAVNTAIRDLVVRGRLNATSVMVVAPSLHRSEAVALDVLNAAAPRVAIGLHLTLTAPFRPLTKGFAPLRDGRVSAARGDCSRHALLRRLDRAALEAEIAARSTPSSTPSAARPISSTGISTCICSRRSATRCSRS